MGTNLPRRARRGCGPIVKAAFVGFVLFGLAMCAYAMSQYG